MTWERRDDDTVRISAGRLPSLVPGRAPAPPPLGDRWACNPAGRQTRPDGEPDRAGARDVAGLLLRGGGQLILTAGVILLLFVAYEIWGTDLNNAGVQARLGEGLRQDWEHGGPAHAGSAPTGLHPETGQAFAFLHIPRLSAGYARTLVEGVGAGELSQGPGHYPDSAMPGERGNFAVAGHRVGRGSPFLDLDMLRPGDPIVVETDDWWYVYRVLGDPASGGFADPARGLLGRDIVSPADVAVIAPTPGGPPDAAPTGAYLTLTTCHPKFSARQRLVIHAVLSDPPVSRRDAPRGPAALREAPGGPG